MIGFILKKGGYPLSVSEGDILSSLSLKIIKRK
jgi:hypothetical protein